MAINNNDVKLFESHRLTDDEDGDGRVTGNEVIDGNVNNLFQDISRIDRTVGYVVPSIRASWELTGGGSVKRPASYCRLSA